MSIMAERKRRNVFNVIKCRIHLSGRLLVAVLRNLPQ